jgi:transposase
MATICSSVNCPAFILSLPSFHGPGPRNLLDYITGCRTDDQERQRLKTLLEQSPRAFGKERSTWTLHLVAQVAQEQGLTGDKVLNIESVRVALRRLNMNWKRAKAWINSPDPAYARKKSAATGS